MDSVARLPGAAAYRNAVAGRYIDSMNQRKPVMKIYPLLAAALLAGCVTPKFVPHVSEITSEPSGATVTYDGLVIGTTPMVFNFTDRFGLLSKYELKASKPGYQDVLLTFSEPTVFHAHGAVPKAVRFELKAK